MPADKVEKLFMVHIWILNQQSTEKQNKARVWVAWVQSWEGM